VRLGSGLLDFRGTYHAREQAGGRGELGTKTIALPDDALDGDITELIDLGPDIPSAVCPKLVQILQKNATAFGVGG
jgi:hypothetical protein